MVRTQVQLTEEQARTLKALAATTGLSMAELIRQGVDALVAREIPTRRDEAYERAARASGRHRSGRSDTSQRHDDHLAKVYAE